MLQSGFRDQNGERIAGMRELLEKLRRRRSDELERYDLGGVYDDIAQELREVVDMERAGIDELRARGPPVGRPAAPGDHRRGGHRAAHAARPAAARPGRPGAELQDYEFTSSEARERFDELIDKLRQQLMQSYFNQMSGAHVGRVSPSRCSA